MCSALIYYTVFIQHLKAQQELKALQMDAQTLTRQIKSLTEKEEMLLYQSQVRRK